MQLASSYGETFLNVLRAVLSGSMTVVVIRSVVGLSWVLMSLFGVACARTHVVPPFPTDAAHDSSMDASRDSANDSADIDGSADDDGSVHPRPTHLARNIIVFMGDGMGADQLAAGRFVAGGRLRIDSLAGPALSNTDSLTTLRTGEVTDSAAASTAYATGTLVDNGVISVLDGRPLETVLEVCQRAGKATGLVTTSMFYDASPAGFAAHQTSRGKVREIATEMLGVTRPDVVMGVDSERLFDFPETGVRMAADQTGYTVVRNVTELLAWDPVAHPRLLGIFDIGSGHTMTPEINRTTATSQPRLATMTQRAIERLSQDRDGFFLFAEDEIFDEMGHGVAANTPEWTNRAYPPQAQAFDDAVGVAIDWVLAHSSFEETLIVVFADHETGGYHFDHTLGPSSGAFSNPGVHTRTPIEVYALGPGSNSIFLVRSHLDTHRLMLGLLP